MKTLENIIDELGISTDIDLQDALHEYMETGVDKIDREKITEKLYDYINSNYNIVYSSNAMEYLSENDMSLGLSLAIASELGYETKNLNSELLATLLYQSELTAESKKIVDQIMDEIEEELAS